jgi:hypothetical protein
MALGASYHTKKMLTFERTFGVPTMMIPYLGKKNEMHRCRDESEKKYLALVRATFNRRGSLRNPMP